MKKRLIIMSIFLIVVFGGLFAWYTFRSMMMQKFFASMGTAPVTISAHPAKAQAWQPTIQAVGNFKALKGVEITAQAAGMVRAISFESGQQVQKGALLVQLDDAIDQANLADNLSRLKLAKLNLRRQQNLFKKNATPSQSVDEATAQFQQAEAAVKRTQATIAHKAISAPFSGRIGIRQVNIGEYINPGSSTIATLQAIDPLYVEFYLPEQQLTHIHVGQAIEINTDALPETVIHGKINAINAKVNQETLNVLVQATVPNPENKLLPGMFANTRIMLPKLENIITIPQTAVAYSLYGDSVYVVETLDKDGKPQKIAKRRFVRTGEKAHGRVVILEGLNAGDEVIDSGQLKINNDTPVTINNEIKLD